MWSRVIIATAPESSQNQDVTFLLKRVWSDDGTHLYYMSKAGEWVEFPIDNDLKTSTRLYIEHVLDNPDVAHLTPRGSTLTSDVRVEN